MHNLNNAGMHHKDMALDFLLHIMDQDTRARFMRELPEAYNDIMGREIVQVVRAEDGSPIRKPPLTGLAATYAREAHDKALADARALLAAEGDLPIWTEKREDARGMTDTEDAAFENSLECK